MLILVSYVWLYLSDAFILLYDRVQNGVQTSRRTASEYKDTLARVLLMGDWLAAAEPRIAAIFRITKTGVVTTSDGISLLRIHVTITERIRLNLNCSQSQ